MLVKSTVWKFSHHQIRARIQGFGIHRIISKLMELNIPIENIRYVNETELQISITWKGYKKLKEISGSNFKVTIISEKGITPIRVRLSDNKLFFVGIIIFVVYFFFQGLFVKEIDITGLRSIPENNVRQILKENGLYEGAFKNFNCKKIERDLFHVFDNIVYANVAYQGRYVKIEISENEQMPKKLVDQEQNCDIIANCDGYIEDIKPLIGRKAVNVGDYVNKGDVLISGAIPIEYSSYQPKEEDPLFYYVHASGVITVRIPYYYSFTIGRENHEAKANKKIENWIKMNIPENAQILNKSLNFIEKENIIKVYGIIETRQKIGIEKEILIDEPNGRIEKDSN